MKTSKKYQIGLYTIVFYGWLEQWFAYNEKGEQVGNAPTEKAVLHDALNDSYRRAREVKTAYERCEYAAINY